MNFLNVFKHLLPNARAWSITVSKKLREFFEGLAPIGTDVKTFFDDIWLDVFPQTTRELDAWEFQFNLTAGSLTEQERRDRLDATWAAQGGQSPRYIQDTLQDAGFDVFVHDWWQLIPVYVAECGEPEIECGEPAAECGALIKQVQPEIPIAHNPLTVLRQSNGAQTYVTGAGEPLMEAGETIAQAGESTELVGYPLVNLLISTQANNTTGAGEVLMRAGEPTALAGGFTGFITVRREYIIPVDEQLWPYFMYVGGEVFGDLAQVSLSRRNEFETLLLKICPAHLWIGVIVEYQ